MFDLRTVPASGPVAAWFVSRGADVTRVLEDQENFGPMQSGPGNIHRSYSLIVSMYESAALFPKLPAARPANHSYGGRIWDFYGSRIQNTASAVAITTPIVGVKLGEYPCPSSKTDKTKKIW